MMKNEEAELKNIFLKVRLEEILKAVYWKGRSKDIFSLTAHLHLQDAVLPYLYSKG